MDTADSPRKQEQQKRDADKDSIKELLVLRPYERFLEHALSEALKQHQLDPDSITRQLSRLPGEYRKDREQELIYQRDDFCTQFEKRFLSAWWTSAGEHKKERTKELGIRIRKEGGPFPYDWMEKTNSDLIERRPLVVSLLNFLDRQNKSLSPEQCERLSALVPSKKHIIEKRRKDGLLYTEESNYSIIVMDNKLLTEAAETFGCPPAYVKEHIHEFHRVGILKWLGKLGVGKKGEGAVIYADGFYQKNVHNPLRGTKRHFLKRENTEAWLSLFPVKASSSSVHKQSRESKKRRKSKEIEGSKS